VDILNINNGVAMRVLEAIRGLIRNVPVRPPVYAPLGFWALDVYSNGREQGYAVTNGEWTRRAAFSENRTSDDIVVYLGTVNDFEYNTNIPSEEIWLGARYFKPDDIVGAAQEVVDWLLKGEK
jgi:hypothetical protein